MYINDSLIQYGKDIELVAKRFDDDIIWLHLSTEYFNIINDYHLCLCYNVPAGSTREVMVDTNIFDRVTLHIVKLKSISDGDCKFLICGDFNAMTGDLKDYVSDDDSRHIYPLPEDYTADEQLPRKNKDTVVNSSGRLLLDFCKGTGLRIANGRVGQDANIGECTYVGRNGSSLIDYILVSQNMLDMFSSFHVCTPNIFSDHGEVKFSLSEIIAPDELQGNILNFEDPNVGSKYIWNKTLQDEYVTKLSAPETAESFEYVFKDINDGTSNNQIDECVNNFVSMLDGVCKSLFERKVLLNQDNYSKIQCDEGCEMYKQLFLEKLNTYRKNKSDANRIEFVEARSAYKKSVRNFKYDCLKNKTQYLLQQKHKDAKQYWNLLKE